MFEGCATALVTPFRKDGSLDEKGLRELVDFQEGGGVDAIVPCGTTGESATLTHEEHLRVIEIVIDQAKKAKVIAGAGSNATHEAVKLSEGAQDLGAEAILSISPYYNKPSQRGIIHHYETVAKSIDVPLIVYNVPGRTSSNIEASTILKLADVPNILGVKEASGNINQIMTILSRAPEGFSVYSGDDAMTFPMMAMGAKGVISVASNVVPDRVKSMADDLLAGEWERARETHFRLLPLFKNLFIETNPVPVKTSLRLMGKPSGPFRLPLCDMEPPNLEVLKRTLADLGVI